MSSDFIFRGPVVDVDPELKILLDLEDDRQDSTIILIASESESPEAVREVSQFDHHGERQIHGIVTESDDEHAFTVREGQIPVVQSPRDVRDLEDMAAGQVGDVFPIDGDDGRRIRVELEFPPAHRLDLPVEDVAVAQNYTVEFPR